MYRHPFDVEMDARYIRQRVADTVAATRPVPRGTIGRPAPGTPSSLAWLRRSVGRLLIASGERLAGPAACPPAAPRPAA